MDSGWGSINLASWMLFHDKEHFKSVLRDYCIQCGFTLVVHKSSPSRFIAVCKDFKLRWRIHSSLVPDGRTWAIKNIQNMEHTCSRFDERNPLVHVKWAASR